MTDSTSERGYRHAYLLASLLLMMTARPFLTERMVGLALVEILLGLTLLLGALASVRKGPRAIAICCIAGLTGLAQVSWKASGDTTLLYLFLTGYVVFYAVVAWVISRKLFQRNTLISIDTLCGAFAVYLLIGVMWMLLYVMLESAIPGSFTFNFAGEALDYDQRFERLLGFSFTTLTTLGFGNVAPATPKADSLANLEAILGQVYLTVVVARLVALQLIQELRKS